MFLFFFSLSWLFLLSVSHLVIHRHLSLPSYMSSIKIFFLRHSSKAKFEGPPSGPTYTKFKLDVMLARDRDFSNFVTRASVAPSSRAPTQFPWELASISSKYPFLCGWSRPSIYNPRVVVTPALHHHQQYPKTSLQVCNPFCDQV